MASRAVDGSQDGQRGGGKRAGNVSGGWFNPPGAARADGQKGGSGRGPKGSWGAWVPGGPLLRVRCAPGACSRARAKGASCAPGACSRARANGASCAPVPPFWIAGRDVWEDPGLWELLVHGNPPDPPANPDPPGKSGDLARLPSRPHHPPPPHQAARPAWPRLARNGAIRPGPSLR
jgi:hypothetical protein